MKLIFASILSTALIINPTINASAQENDTFECDFSAQVAEYAMKNRQNDISIEYSLRNVSYLTNSLMAQLDPRDGKEFNERAVNVIKQADASSRLIVEWAYKKPYGYSQQMKNKYITEFTSLIYTACMKDKRR